MNGKLANLNKFLSKSAEKSLSLFRTLKKCTKKSDFQWTAKAEVAFKQIKKLKAELPILTAPMEKEELIVYLVAAREAYRLRTSVKGQILADFIVERPEEDSLVTTTEVEEDPSELWTLFMDRSSCMDGSEAGLILTSSEGTHSKRVRHGTEAEVLTVVEEEGSTWMTPIYEYLMKETLLAEKEKARALQRKSGRYAVINGVLYKNSYLGPWLRCDGPLQANYVLREIHEGSYIIHTGTRSVVAKALRIEYYWPTIPFSEGPGKVKLLIVAIDYFTKWIKAKPVATITWTTHLKIGVKSCAYANTLPPSSIRKPMEIPHVLWAHYTMIKSSNGDTPFSLTYGTEAVIPAEIGMPTLRTSEIDMVHNDEALEINLDLLEERR
ncbi:hypothetical protein Tco_1240506 [Tanacetum coccineum]